MCVRGHAAKEGDMKNTRHRFFSWCQATAAAMRIQSEEDDQKPKKNNKMTMCFIDCSQLHIADGHSRLRGGKKRKARLQ